MFASCYELKNRCRQCGFLLLGVLGFVPGVTRNLWSLSLVGHRSGALLFGVFQVSILLNLMHLAFGVAGVLLARTMSGAHRYLLLGGAFYLVLFVYGMIVSQGSEANFVPVTPRTTSSICAWASRWSCSAQP
jgi:Domain of unknown function (DUF4383)